MNGRVAAVLGVGPGLGAAVARRFAGEGFAVAMMARREESLAEIRQDIEEDSGTALPVSADATDADSVAAAFERVRDDLGDPKSWSTTPARSRWVAFWRFRPTSSTSASGPTAPELFQRHSQTHPLQDRARAARSGRLSARRDSRRRACRL